MEFNKLYDKIVQNYERKEQGSLLSIEPPFPRLATRYGGWVKGLYYCITAFPSVGKSKYAKFLTVLSVIKACEGTNIKPKIFYFALEESEEDFWLSMMSYWIYENYKISLSVKELLSVGRSKLTREGIKKLHEAEKFVTNLQKYVTVIDYIRNPTGMVKYVKSYFDNPSVGEWIKEKHDDKEYIRGYTYKDDDHWVFGVFDHISLMSAESRQGVKMDIYHTLDFFSKEYCMNLFCKVLKMVTVSVHQQSPSGESLQFTNRGEIIESALEPSAENLHWNKALYQDYDIMMGLHSPYRYGLQEHRSYKIPLLGKAYRSLKFLKDRHFGLEGDYIGLQFNGINGVWKELPKAQDLNTGQARYEDWKL